jgi:arginyl-tRNA--protein-N-Asp/Glu arginylyltransferase
MMLDVSPEELDHLLARGWRRFGPAYFRPRCQACSECVPLRIPVADFEASRSQRRVWRSATGFGLRIGRPQVDERRLDLYRRWHAMQSASRGWPDEEISPDEYAHQFAFPHPSVREFAYYDQDRLIAVGIVDETPHALSAVYTYHDPDYRKHSLGTFSVLFQLEVARSLGKEWLYLGYRVRGCPSSEYKARFRPHEILRGWPELNETPDWGDDQRVTSPLLRVVAH